MVNRYYDCLISSKNSLSVSVGRSCRAFQDCLIIQSLWVTLRWPGVGGRTRRCDLCYCGPFFGTSRVAVQPSGTGLLGLLLAPSNEGWVHQLALLSFFATRRVFSFLHSCSNQLACGCVLAFVPAMVKSTLAGHSMTLVVGCCCLLVLWFSLLFLSLLVVVGDSVEMLTRQF